jgi:hypothetical protein
MSLSLSLFPNGSFPSFIVPKKDGTARFVSDFRLLNQLLADELHHLPIIRDVLNKKIWLLLCNHY